MFEWLTKGLAGSGSTSKLGSQYKDVAGNIFGSREQALASSNDYAFTDPSKYGSATVSEVPSVSANSSLSNGGGLGLSSIGGILGGIGDLTNAWVGYKQLGLAEDALNYNMNMKDKEYAMAKDAYDRNVARANSIGSQMQAGRVG